MSALIEKQLILPEPVPVRGIIKIYYYCNSFCVFCHSEENKIYPADFEAAARKIKEAIAKGQNQILFSGGEPTIYRRFLELLDIPARLGLVSGIISNGRKLQDSSFVHLLLDKNVRYFYLSLHSSDEATHDKITESPGSWQEAVSGFENLLAATRERNITIDFTVNYVLTGNNMDHMDDFVRFMKKLGVPKIKFSFPQHKGRANEEMVMEHPTIEQAAGKIIQALELANQENIRASHDGMPYCFLPKQHRFNFENLQTHRIYYMTEIYEDHWYLTDEGSRYYADACRSCSYYKVCLGIPTGARFDQVKPVVTAIPDHMDLLHLADLPALDCLLEGSPAYRANSEYRLALHEENVLKFYEFDQSFFKIDTFERIKSTQQIYSAQHAGNVDLPNLKKLSLKNKCQNCFQAQNGACGGIYEKTEQRFDSGFENFRRLFSALQGRVLEIGCGRLLLTDLLCQKNPDYVGIDVDEKQIESNRLQYPQANFFVGDLKAYFAQNSLSFESALMIGSYNHIENLIQFTDDLKKIMQPGGRVFILENEPYGLIPFEAEEPKQPNDRFLHYRNHNLETAADFFKQQGFLINQGIDLGPKNNFWFLALERV